MAELSASTLTRIAQLLLVVAAISAGAALLLGARLVYRSGEIAALQARLLAENELQAELLRSTSKDHALYPHVANDVGYVLNPGLGRSTWKAADGQSYAVNSLGLRGDELHPPREGVRRVVILGDSAVFGWRIADEERLPAVLDQLVTARLGPDRFEFVSAAIPGWNIRSEAAFLRSHAGLLQPSLLVWSVLLNDVIDVPAAVPPGVLARWTSPQKDRPLPFLLFKPFHYRLPIPAVEERWRANFDAIEAASVELGAPVVLLFWQREDWTFLDPFLQERDFDPPAVVVPPRYAADERWTFSRLDQHPSAWANRTLAFGLLAALADEGHLPALALDDAEREVADAFRVERRRRPSEQEIASARSEDLARIPNRTPVGRARAAVLSGVVADGEMLQNGILVLRDTPAHEQDLSSQTGSSRVEVEMAFAPEPSGRPRQVRFTLRDRSGASVSHEFAIADEQLRVDLAVPLGSEAPGEIYELHWEFDRAACRSPSLCVSGRLVAAGFGN